MTGILVIVAVAVGVAILVAVVARRPRGSARTSGVDPESHTHATPDARAEQSRRHAAEQDAEIDPGDGEDSSGGPGGGGGRNPRARTGPRRRGRG